MALAGAVSAAGAVDYAESRQVDAWLRHPVYGDPSFDAFERATGNPVHTGAPPFEWPVNGFFFPAPASGNWYLYIGDYARGYGGPPPSRCVLYRSKNRGHTWENLGTVLQGDAGLFDKNGHTPDVSVVFANGRYHMIYDWGELEFNREGGIAYAWAEKPEGPWHRAPQPVTRNTTLTPLLGKYSRTQAAALVQREHDWMILAMMDSAPRSWALFGMTADKPEGPYSERKLLVNVESDSFHPPLMEFSRPSPTTPGCMRPPPRWPTTATSRQSSARRWNRRVTPTLGKFSATARCGTRRMCGTKPTASGGRCFPAGWIRTVCCA